MVSHPVASLAPLRLTALAHSKLDTLLHNRCAGGCPFYTDTRASCVSVGYRHGSPHLLRLAEAMCYSMPPIHEGDTHRTLKPSTLMYLRSRYAIVPDAQRWL
ncbi:MAG: hypothetical protein SPL78_07355 [Bacteroidales bacterium]|nr:hypothetical protein [Bacteroidales bacterium]